LTVPLDNIGTVAQQPAGFGHLAEWIDRGHGIARRQRGELDALPNKKWIVSDQQRLRALFSAKAVKDRIDLAAGASVQKFDC